MLVCLPALVLSSEDGHISTFSIHLDCQIHMCMRDPLQGLWQIQSTVTFGNPVSVINIDVLLSLVLAVFHVVPTS